MSSSVKTFICVLLVLLSQKSYSEVLFADDFQNGPSTSWGNQRGEWTAQDGKYYASITGPSFPLWPMPHSLLPFEVTDFELNLKIWDFQDGGVMLRAQDSSNAVLLVVGGLGGVGDYMYWHVLQNGIPGEGLNPSASIGIIGSYDPSLKIVVQGDTYQVFLDGNPNAATTLTTDAFSSGKVGLFDNATPATQFSNVVLIIPEPSAFSLLAAGLVLVLRRRRTTV